jgi:predicted phosphodiesterase
MKIQVWSDAHFEFHADQGKSFIAGLNKDCDVLCIAGDLATYDLLEDSLKRLCDVWP